MKRYGESTKETTDPMSRIPLVPPYPICSAQLSVLGVVEHSRISGCSQDSMRSANAAVPHVNIGGER